MARIVMKFGGTSVGSIERIQNVARIVQSAVDAGHQVAVCVSAMSGETNRLVDLCRQTGALFDLREYDTVVSTGEQVTVGLLAMTLQSMGVDARSWLGWQMPFRTENVHANARIETIDTTEIERRFAESREVAVIAGFQGISERGRITTLGRGGSDTSAVAIAAALNADRCDIYTDVDGVYTTDPRMVPKARKIPAISYDEMLEMASLGAKVLQTRSVSLAKRHKVKLRVLSSMDEDSTGSLICSEDEIVEQDLVSGIAFSKDEAKITLLGVPDRPGTSAAIFGSLGDASINVDMIVQSRTSGDGKPATDLSFTVGRADLDRAVKLMEEIKRELDIEEVTFDESVVKVSVVGVGMRTNSGVAQRMFETLADLNINIQTITTSEIKVSVLIDEKFIELAVRALHSAFGLDVA